MTVDIPQCGNLAIFLPLWFYVKSNLADFWQILTFSSVESNKSKFKASKNIKWSVFWPSEISLNSFHVKSELQENCSASTLCKENCNFYTLMHHFCVCLFFCQFFFFFFSSDIFLQYQSRIIQQTKIWVFLKNDSKWSLPNYGNGKNCGTTWLEIHVHYLWRVQLWH